VSPPSLAHPRFAVGPRLGDLMLAISHCSLLEVSAPSHPSSSNAGDLIFAAVSPLPHPIEYWNSIAHALTSCLAAPLGSVSDTPTPPAAPTGSQGAATPVDAPPSFLSAGPSKIPSPTFALPSISSLCNIPKRLPHFVSSDGCKQHRFNSH